MIDWFKQLTPAAKMLSVAGFVAVLILLIIAQGSRMSSIDPDPTRTPPVGTDNPSDAPGSPTDPTEEPDSTPSPEPTPDLPQTTELPVEDQQAAMTTAISGFLEYYDLSADEAVEARQQRMAPYFASDSETLNESPLGDMITTDDQLKVYSEASINFSEPIGGTAEEFFALIGATVRGQITPPEESGELPYIQKSTMVIFEVALTKQGDAWKITDITEK